MTSSSSGPNSRPQASSSTNAAPERSYFETQRAALIGEIAVSMEHVLANINKLNRSLEGVIAVGNEFGSVEALWSQFENVMAKDPNVVEEAAGEGQERQSEHDEASSEDAGGR